MIIVLGIDPGKTTGYGVLNYDPDENRFSIQTFGTTKDTTLLEIVHLFEQSDICALEIWKTRPANARSGSFDYDPMITPQVEGAARVLSAQHSLKVSDQLPAIKPAGYGFLGHKYVKGKQGQHAWDALAHAAFYCVKNLRAKPLGV